LPFLIFRLLQFLKCSVTGTSSAETSRKTRDDAQPPHFHISRNKNYGGAAKPKTPVEPVHQAMVHDEAFMSGFFAELQRRKVYHVAAMRVSNPDRSPPAILSETLTECVDETKRQ